MVLKFESMLSKIVDLVKSLFLYAFNHCNSLHCWFFITIINQAQSLVGVGNPKAQAQVCVPGHPHMRLHFVLNGYMICNVMHRSLGCIFDTNSNAHLINP